MKLPLHGSNPQYVYEAFNLPLPDEVLDFSVNLNPFGPPRTLHAQWDRLFSLVEDYPDPDGTSLRSLIAREVNLPVASVLLGNGGAELISCIAHMLSGKRVLIVQPTFAEYDKMCRAHGCDVSYIHLTEGVWKLDVSTMIDQLEHADALFLCHPNNPTGVLYSHHELSKLLNACEKYNCLLIIDEAFYDFVPKNITFAHEVSKSMHLVIIRSLTKMYAIAGLRLGYMLADPKLIKYVQSFQPQWSVNALALEAGQICMRDQSHVNKAQSYITTERKRLFRQLKHLGYTLSNSYVNYYLLRDPTLNKQDSLIYWLLERRIVPRHTYNFPGLDGRWIRLAIKRQADNDKLLEALRQWKEI